MDRDTFSPLAKKTVFYSDDRDDTVMILMIMKMMIIMILVIDLMMRLTRERVTVVAEEE